MQKLKAHMNLWQGLALAFSLVVGSGLLGLPGVTIERYGVYNCAASWLVTVLALIPMIAIFSRLGVANPSAGGLSRYARIAVGEWGADAVTFLILGSVLVGIPALGLIAGSYAQHLFGLPESARGGLAIGFFLFTGILNCVSIRAGGLFNSISMVFFLSLILVLVGTNFSFLESGLATVPQLFSSDVGLSYSAVWSCSLVLFWAFLGWEELSFGLEEFKNPNRNIPLVYWISFLLINILYLSLAFTAIGASLHGVSVAGPSGLAALAHQTGFGTVLVAVMVGVAAANTSSNIFANSRLVFAASREGMLPRFLSRLSSKRLPVASVVTCVTIHSLITLFVELQGYSISRLVVLVDQSFLLLFLFAIVAYWKVEKGWRRIVFTGFAGISCTFFFSKVDGELLFPLTLCALGYLGFRLRKKRGNQILSQILASQERPAGCSEVASLPRA